MKQYISYFKLKLSVGLQYRSAALAGLATQLFFGLVYIMVYSAFYKNGSSNVDMTLKQVISYMWLNQAFFSLINIWERDNVLLNMIKKGDVAYELCRPENLYFIWYTRILASKIAKVMLRCLPIIIIAFLLPAPYNLNLPNTLQALLLFILTIIIASLLISALITLMYIFIFYLVDNKGVMNMYCGIAELLAGQIVPIPFFSKTLRIIAELLPFAYISDFAFRIYSGNIQGLTILKGILIEIIWLIILILIGLKLTNKIIKKVIVQGG